MAAPPNLAHNTFLRGFVLVMLLHLLQLVFLTGASLFMVGLTQIIYVGPVAWMAYKQHAKSRLYGILAAAVITFLLNAICDLWIYYRGMEFGS